MSAAHHKRPHHKAAPDEAIGMQKTDAQHRLSAELGSARLLAALNRFHARRAARMEDEAR